MLKKGLNKQNSILLALLEAENWLTGKDIAQRLGISDRTVRTEIALLCTELAKSDVSILSSRGKGYYIDPIFKPKVRATLTDTASASNHGEYLVLRELLSARHPLDLDDLADSLFLSRATLENTIKQLRDALSEACQKLEFIRRNSSIFLQGDEIDKRAAMNRFLVDGPHSHMNTDLVHYSAYFDYDDLIFAKDVVYRQLKQSGLTMSDISIIAITLHVMIAILRVEEGFILEKGYKAEARDGVENVELKVSKAIFAEILQKKNLDFNDFEQESIAHYISFKRLFPIEGIAKEEVLRRVDEAYIRVVEESLEEIRDIYFLDLTADEDLRYGLAYHIKELSKRLIDNINYVNPILDDIKSKYPFVFELAVVMRRRIAQMLGLDFSESEVACLAIHMGAAIERLSLVNKEERLSAAFVCHGSQPNARFLMAKLISMFGGQIELKGPFSNFDKESVLGISPSIIISTSTAVLDWSNQVPVATVKLVPDGRDITQLSRMISAAGKEASISHKLKNFFNEEYCYFHLDFETPAQIINYMSDKLAAGGKVIDGFKEATHNRERFSTTVLQNMVALPHPTGFYSNETTIAVATLKKPINWNGRTAQLIFMLAVKNGDQQYLKDFYSLLVGISESEEKVKKLLAVKSFEEFVFEICRHETH